MLLNYVLQNILDTLVYSETYFEKPTGAKYFSTPSICPLKKIKQELSEDFMCIEYYI